MSKWIVVTSAAPPNGDGYGTALAFDIDGQPPASGQQAIHGGWMTKIVKSSTFRPKL